MSDRHNVGWQVGLCLVTTFTAIACTRSPEVAPTVTYFREHADERRDVMKRCSDDPGTLGKTPTCVTAQQATLMEGVGTFRNLPPMGLPGERNGTEAPAAGESPTRR
jgi:hypothetical protein